LVEKKGFDIVIGAIDRMRAEVPEVRCVIVGDGDQRQALEAQVSRLGLDRHVTFTGALPQPQVAEWMRRAHVMAAPCRVGSDGNQDALPTVLVEALAAGLPAVSTPVAGIAEIVEHGVEGVLVDENDVVGLAEALCGLIGDDARWRAMSSAGPVKLAARFDRANTIRELLGIFSNAEVMA